MQQLNNCLPMCTCGILQLTECFRLKKHEHSYRACNLHVSYSLTMVLGEGQVEILQL